MSLPSNAIHKSIVHKASQSSAAAHKKRGKSSKCLSGPNSIASSDQNLLLVRSLVDSAHNPLPSWLPWFRRIYSRLPLSLLLDLSTGRLMYSTGTCVRVLSETLWVPLRCPPAALHCEPIQPASTALALPSRMKFSHSPPTAQGGFLLQVGNFQPLPKLREVRAWSSWCLPTWHFPRYPSFSLEFFDPLPSPIRPVRSAPEWMLREKQSEAGCTVLPLRLTLSLTHSCCRPPFSQFLTAPPHPFIFYLLLSFPLALTDTLRYALLWLFTITVVPLPTMSTRKIRLPNSTREQIAPVKYVRLNRSGKKRKRTEPRCRSTTWRLLYMVLLFSVNFFLFVCLFYLLEVLMPENCILAQRRLHRNDHNE